MTENFEIEIKAWCRGFEPVVRLLEEMGARRGETKNEKDTYYSHPVRNFAETDEALRVRESGGKAVLTYKGPKISVKAKTRVEHEAVFDDASSVKRILADLGFKESGEVNKTRKTYHLNGIEIDLDDVASCGLFVELEKIGSETAAIEAELFDLAERLGLEHFERRSYLELLLGKAKAPF
ncbi:MAG: class IV adenylate cyclase [Leptospirales bacterium]|nr:class IV adenylate cyclase [Leptospirales bacterium]